MAVNFMRACLSLPFFLGFALVRSPGSPLGAVTADRAGWLLVSVLGSYVVGDALFLASAHRVGVPVALAIASTYPLWSAFAGWSLLGQSVGPAGFLGVALVVCGVVVVVRQRADRGGGGGRTPSSDHTAGFLLAAGTSLFWALNTFAVARGGEGLGVAEVNTVRMGFAAAILPLVRVALRGRGVRLLVPAKEMRRAWPFFLMESVTGTALFVYGLTHSPLAVAAALTSLAPVLSIPFAFVVSRDRVSGPALAGIALVTAGIVLLVSFGRS